MGLRIYDRRYETFHTFGLKLPVRLSSELAADLVPFDIQDVVDWHVQRNQKLDVREIGAIVPPFEHCWLEWVRWENPIAVRVESQRMPEGWALAMQSFAEIDGRLMATASTSYVYLNERGMVEGWEIEYDDSTVPGDPNDSVREEMLVGLRKVEASTHRGTLAAAMMALAFANLKNADVELEPKRRLSNAHRRKLADKTPRRFRRIYIPGTNKGGTGTGGSRDTPAHLVRGHFKTYTTDAPLFGQHVGTYWWSWHPRGDEAHGSVDHEYVVAPPSTDH